MMDRRSVLLSGLAWTVGAGALSQQAGCAKEAKRDLTLGMVLEPPGLDPTAGAASAIGEITLYNIYETLTKIQSDGSVQPLLADAEEQRRAQLAELLDQRRSQNRVLEDLADIARAATAGAVDTLIVDRAANESGSLDEAGNLTLDDSGINVVDEVAGRVLTTGGTVLALPDAKTSAILRYAL